MKRWPDYHGYLAFTAMLSATLLGGIAVGSHAVGSRPKDDNLYKRLERSISVVWSEAPLGDALNRLGDSQELTIWLDRRVDPGRCISLVARDVPLKDVLARVAQDQELGICLFQSVVYLGPPAAVARLRTLGELRRRDARKLPQSIARRLFRAESMRWEDLAAPRDLLTRMTKEGNLKIVSAERVVHDLWPAADLPPLQLVDRLTLVLAPLDLTFQFERRGTQIRLIPIPDRVALTRRYPAGRHPEDVAGRWSRLLPESRVRIEGNRIVVEGPLEDHERLKRPEHSTGRRPGQAQRTSDTNLDNVRVHRPKFKDLRLENVIRQLAVQLNLHLQFDADALRRSGVDLDQRISLELKGDVTINELLQAVLEPAGLTFQLRGRTLEIRAAWP